MSHIDQALPSDAKVWSIGIECSYRCRVRFDLNSGHGIAWPHTPSNRKYVSVRLNMPVIDDGLKKCWELALLHE